MINPFSDYFSLIQYNKSVFNIPEAQYINALNYSAIVYAIFSEQQAYIDFCYQKNWIVPVNIFLKMSDNLNLFNLSLLMSNPKMRELYESLTEKDLIILHNNQNSKILIDNIHSILNFNSF